jgi:hypothetical protein
MEALPTTTTAAPTTGAPFASTIVPLMARFWAVATVPRRPAATIITAAAILAKNCLVIKALIWLVKYGLKSFCARHLCHAAERKNTLLYRSGLSKRDRKQP